jgi:hypothetical protein
LFNNYIGNWEMLKKEKRQFLFINERSGSNRIYGFWQPIKPVLAAPNARDRQELGLKARAKIVTSARLTIASG